MFNSINPILKLVFPVIGGLIIQSFGYSIAFIASAFTLLAVTSIASIQKTRKISFDYSSAIRRTKGVRMLVFLEGLESTVCIMLIPLITLSFIQKELVYGIFLSVVSLFGVFAAMIMTRRSDKVYERASYIYPTAILSSVFAILAAMSNSLLLWTIFVGLLTFTIRILSPFFEAVVIDARKSLVDSMHSREIFLSLGRAAGGGIVILSLVFFNSLKMPIIIIALATLAYPFLLSKKRIYKHSYTITDYFTDNSINLSKTVAPQFLMLMPRSVKPKRNDRLFYDWRYGYKKIR